MARTDSRPHIDPPVEPTTRPDTAGGRRGRHASVAPWRIVRTPSDRILAGVAGGLGEQLGVDPVIVRLAFVVLAFAAGAGVIAYLVCWALSVDPAADGAVRAQPDPADATQRGIAVGLVVGGLLLMFRGLGAWLGDAVVWPILLGAVGSAIIWTRADHERRARWTLAARRLPRQSVLAGPVSVLRVAFGGLLILAGMAVFLAANRAFSLGAVRNVLFAIGVTVAGAVLILGPGVWRLVRQLTAERRQRIRSEERAEVAAHLHDSVLQSLAMIQRARTAEEMATLARAQERELRAWLYGPGPPPGGTLRGSIEVLAGRIEELHHVEVEVVQVGDARVDERLQALVQAAGEAMTNAARHSGARRVDVYVEVEPTTITAFVRDRGKGFDPGAVDEDRHGIAESIRGRMERSGGAANVTTAPGEGTEVALRMPPGGGVSEPVRVFLVDDHRLFLSGVRAELGQQFEVAGEATDVPSAIEGIRASKPDVVLVDVHMPDGGGARVIREAAAFDKPPRFLALSVSDAAEDVIEVIRAGARGYVTKTISPDDLAEAVRRVHEGDAVFGPRLAGFVLDAFSSDAPPKGDPELDQLTAREREVLRLIARGYAYKEIARELFISVKTVETHVSAVLRKLQLSNRSELTRWATERRLV